MGVHELWPILEPVKQHVSLQSLGGKTLAVDLSIWVCEAQSVKQMVGVVAKPHLRNLFFRVSSLNLMGVKLVFVTEGEAPKVKADTMKKRNEMRYGASKKTAPARPGRSYFKAVLKDCLRMLDCLGVPWVQAAGEAEAMCAYLNAEGHVDGCVTNDGDVFLYGAQTVYRNFTMNVKDPHVDCYEVSAIKDRLGLDRESMVGLAILLGCDYIPKGLPGVGRELAMKFMKSLHGESVLQRFYQWRKQFDEPAMTKTFKKKVHCSVCSHPGSTKEHERKGCELCGSKKYCEPHDYDYCCPCDWHKAEKEKKNNSMEYTFKMKAKKREGFPYPEVIQEFLVNKDKLVKVIKWMRPSLLCFQNFALEWMEWPKHYSCEKVLILLTYYDMHERKAGPRHDAQLQAVRIVKTRVRNGIPCFEIEWVKPDGYIFPDDHPPDGPLLTIEEESLFTGAYPHIVELFQKDKLEAEMLKQQCKKSKPKPKVLPNVDDVASLMSEMSLTPTVETNVSPLILEVSEDSETTTCLDGSGRSKDLPGNEGPLPTMVTLVSRNKDLDISTTPAYIRDDLDILDGQWSSPVPGNKSESTAASTNVSFVVADLQLSSIDWEATSFSMSPQAESRTGVDQTHGVQVGRYTGEPVKATYNVRNPTQEIIGTNKDNLEAKSAPPILVLSDSPCITHLQNLPLRERLLLKNAGQYASSEQRNVLLKCLPLKPIPRNLNMGDATKSMFNHNVISKENVQTHKQNESTNKHNYQKGEKQIYLTRKPDPNCRAPERPTTKSFTFVKKIPPASVRPLSDGNISSKMAPMSTKVTQKKSVCQKMTSSSEDDGEPAPGGGHKHAFKKEGAKLGMPVNKMASILPTTTDNFSIPSIDNVLDNVFSSPEAKALHARSPDELSDDDDSIISVDSPLPLSERLKLRLLQNS
ncbi:flap endonuclease GEN homolog 1 [Rhinoderma darwinii]|uniref:flap endonuclease GEN homolog 1 n=1 Tax=Rhinoderma darwinii TaxID=43563 RepID=UPI003F667638